ncbi:MAG TPA: hypothetical protein VK826_17295 [Bacteroidia bacterium]|nr:hypothetical protein [Bacteroidia bacterium]
MFASCGDGMLHEYLNGDSTIWTDVPVYADSTGHAEVTVTTDYGHPEIVVYYGCEEYNIDRLYKINVELIVDGKVIKADSDNLDASYANADVPVSSCCDSIAKKLHIDSTQYMESFSVGLKIVKKYPSLGKLPKQLSVRLTSESAGGNTDSTIVLTLRSQKDTRAPIRFH